MTCTAVRRFRASFSYHRRKEAKHDESEIRAGTMPGVTQEQIEQARESDLFAYIQSHEPGVLKRDGANYRHKEHDSLVYSHLFTEISPQIPKEYERHFTVNGALLPGYTVEGQEPVKAEHTAAEVSEGGISLPEKTGKPSVLGKLAAAKSQEKAPAAPAATKKKEDMQL